ncbi:hypothetical protein [Sphingomonas sp.]|uniref:hypothetical protein n=1 Tax=Sphingomonas sp. TaxID=28214 RepID=UPI0038AEFF24
MRPLSVTIVGWWLVVTSLLGVYSSATMHTNPQAVQLLSSSPFPLQAREIFGVINGFVLAFCGVAVLKGMSWARLAFLGWSFVGFVFGILAIGFLLSALLSGLAVVVIMFFLSRPKANDWFRWQ